MRAYKRQCFQGRSAAARWLDRLFFSALCGAGLNILLGKLLPSLLLLGSALLLFTLWDGRRWSRFERKLYESVRDRLRREDWLLQEAERIRQGDGKLLYPTPEGDALSGFCLRYGPGTAFHCIGKEERDLVARAETFRCTVTFHPWGFGAEPSLEAVNERLKHDAPERRAKLWPALLRLPGNRYLLTGCLLLLLSVFLRRALYWRLLGTLCLFIGAIRRCFQTVLTIKKSP